MSYLKAGACLLLLIFAQLSVASVDPLSFKTDQDRERFHHLAKELRCPKCQNQSIADSDAPVALDLRAMLLSEIEQGKTDEQIMQSMVNRYGEFILYRPDIASKGGIVWLLSIIIVMFAVGILFFFIKRRKSVMQQNQSIDNAALSRLLDEESK